METGQFDGFWCKWLKARTFAVKSSFEVAANAAIAQRYQALNGFRGRLGVAMSSVTAEDASSHAFVQHYRAGDLHFDDLGLTTGDNLRATVVTYKGIHCFGNPGFLKSASYWTRLD